MNVKNYLIYLIKIVKTEEIIYNEKCKKQRKSSSGEELKHPEWAKEFTECQLEGDDNGEFHQIQRRS